MHCHAEFINLDGIIDENKNVQYIGLARRQCKGVYNCVAIVGGALCLVEVNAAILVHKGEGKA